jgi:hypothetical protein
MEGLPGLIWLLLLHHRRDLSALRAFREDDPEAGCCLVSFAAEPLVMDGIRCEPLDPWLRSLGV